MRLDGADWDAIKPYVEPLQKEIEGLRAALDERSVLQATERAHLQWLEGEVVALQKERDLMLAELKEFRSKEPPLLQCADCKNTESCAGAMARYFNHGRCLHCGGYFKVVRA